MRGAWGKSIIYTVAASASLSELAPERFGSWSTAAGGIADAEIVFRGYAVGMQLAFAQDAAVTGPSSYVFSFDIPLCASSP